MRDYTKFFTLPETAKFMAELLDPKHNDVILEPSAGNGALVKAVIEQSPKSIIFAFELDPQWEDDLRKSGDTIVVIKDFLDVPVYAKFSSCIANPPFGNSIDLQAHFDHIRAAVKTGGRIVMIVPEDFEPPAPYYYRSFPLKNWGTNKDGTVTSIKIISFLN